MRRCAGCHTNRDTLGSVHQQVGNLDGQNAWFFLRLIEVGQKIHHVFVQIRQKSLLRDLRQTCFRITHCCRTVTLNIAEIAMAVNQGHFLLKILSHYHKRFIDGTVTVGMVFTHGISHDTSRFTIGSVVAYTEFIHIIKSSSLYRLQSVPHIRQCTCNDNTHGIIYVRFLHYLGIFRFDDPVIYTHFFFSPLIRVREANLAKLICFANQTRKFFCLSEFAKRISQS